MNLTRFGMNVDKALLEKNPALAIPYITFLSICCVTGTFGNILVIVSIVASKVRSMTLRYRYNAALT